ncbi:MAG: hypothetical protein R3C05_05900 [Pirellulaceae bacterium]
MYSFFTPSVPTPTMPLFSDAQKQQVAELQRRITELESHTPVLKSQHEPRFKNGLSRGDASNEIAENHGDVKPDSHDHVPSGQIKHLDFEDQSTDGIVGKAILLNGDDEHALDVGNFRRFDPVLRFVVAAKSEKL